jgi:tRNA threonylcarbamoyladenosine modification (KEOPS) complex  Pcc1 subunit
MDNTLSERVLAAVRATDVMAMRSGRATTFRLFMALMILFSDVRAMERDIELKRMGQ